jgi:ATP-dependent Clp protease adaptor protein ClpS
MSEQIIEKKLEIEDIGTDKANSRLLILYNDDVNTFDFVIKSLVEVCKLDSLQAEQCSLLVHYKGKADVKKGSYNTLLPMKEALIDRGLTAEIN